ncbi:casein kinase I isoform delta [Ilyonectria robusta]|uniref:casein kinase I isoform delta n=1 Tax=Ilyonectria robusta TaxID=1079257 RepID=UPI001E8CBB02|nr:casein kinase I isoform delta [Ilyonectria robusta]KAH8676942.1 casein kinase I isoform delta [Ilyonectria robusta]
MTLLVLGCHSILTFTTVARQPPNHQAAIETTSIMKDIIINKKYRVDRKIGQGGFGLVYIGTDIESNEIVAMKLMRCKDGPDMSRHEVDVLRALSGGIGMPRFMWFGVDCDYYVLICDLLGPSLGDLLNYCGGRFSLKTTLLIADQAISRLQYIHQKGYIHRDIKPENFTMGAGKQGNVLHTIDFGMAMEVFDKDEDKRFKGCPFGGTARFASLNNHKGLEQCRGDDLESLGYMLLFFQGGSLPWIGLKAATQEEKDKMIMEKKMNIPVETLCQGLPREFETFINYTRSLGFKDKPDYAYLRHLFRRLYNSQGFQYDKVFDWTEKLFHETYGEVVPK